MPGRSTEDQQFLDTTSGRDIEAFRDTVCFMLLGVGNASVIHRVG